MTPKDEKRLLKKLIASRVKHLKKVRKRMEPYEKMNLFERYAIFMGKAQIAELYLRTALANDKGYSFERMERTTLGGLVTLLKKNEANDLIIFLADDVNSYRTHMAHEFLVNQLITTTLLKRKAKKYSKSFRLLEKAVFSIEQFLENYESMPPGYLWKKGKKIDVEELLESVLAKHKSAP